MTRTTGIILDEALNMNPAAPVAGIVDRSIHGNDGTFSHDVSGAGAIDPDWAQLSTKLWVTEYIKTEAQYTTFGTDASLEVHNRMSYEIWANPSAFPGAGDFNGIMTSLKVTSREGFALQINDVGQIQYYGGEGGTVVVNVTAAGLLTVGEWTQIVGTYDGTNIYLYVDGLFRDSIACVSVPIIVATEVGRSYGGEDDYYWNGYLSGARVYNYCMDSAQIADRYNATKGLYGV